MFPKKGPNPYGQPPPYGAQQPYGKIPGSGGYASSTAAAGGADGARFGGSAAQGAVGQYGGPYASVYGTQKVGGLASNGPGSSGLLNLQAHQTALSESSKFSSGAVGSTLGRPNGDYLASCGYAPKLDQYSANYELERRVYGEHSTNIGRRDGLNDLDRRYPDHIPGSHQIHDRVDQVSSTRHPQLLKTQLQPGSDIRQADYFAGRTGPIHQGSPEIGAYGRTEADRHSLSIHGSVPYGGQQQASVLGRTQRSNMDSLVYGQGSSSSGFGVDLPTGRDYASGKSLLQPASESDYRDSILPRVHPVISMVDERTGDRVGYRHELDLRDDERRREILWEKEKEREWEYERELHDREIERERDRERERERREREREREHLRVRREKERERDRKHVAIPRRERTPPRRPVERRRSSSVRSEKPLRRLSPRRDAVHRPRTPVKQIKREYICKVLPFRLVDADRDYLSLTKRYPRLVISPDFCKVVVNWPKGNLNLSMRTPVSLEHDIHEVDDKFDERTVLSSEKSNSSNTLDTVWNVKVLLMSGMSNGAFADICSLRSAEDRIAHWNNVLKFAVFKKDHALVSIGGPWNAAMDGGDPSTDCSCLIQTAIRYTKELVQVDLSNCTHWNHFLEVHYNRIGKDGLFSHKEITVLFVPNLSECVPSVDLWKNTWIAYRKSKADRDKLIIKNEKVPGDTKEQKKGTGVDHLKKVDIGKDATKIEKVDTKMDEQGKDGDAKLAEKEGKQLVKVEEHNKNDEDVQGNTSGSVPVDHAAEDKKPMRKKVIKKVIRKVVREKLPAEALADKSSQVDKAVVAETVSKTAGEVVQQTTVDVSKEKDGAGISQPETKKSGKKKVIRRILKRKVVASGSKLNAPTVPAETSEQAGEIQQENNDVSLTNAGNLQIKLPEGSNVAAEVISNQKKDEKADKGTIYTENQKSNGDKVNEQEVVKEKDTNKVGGNGTEDETNDDKEKNSKDLKKDPKLNSLNDAKEKKRSDEPPKHPGFILQTKKSKDSKLRSISLSLDGLLDYTTNDIEESVFELSLFAESFSEMLQFRMGCIILSFLEKLHKHYVTKKNERKRPREEDVKKEDDKSSKKRFKTTDDTCTENTPNNIGAVKTDEIIDDGKNMIVDQIPAAPDEPETEEKMEDEDLDYEEDPEEVEIYEEDGEDMDGATAEQQDGGNLNSTESNPEEVKGNKEGGKGIKLEKPVSGEDTPTKAGKGGSVEVGEKVVSKEGKTAVSQKGDSTKHELVDKDLLQAFRYFDQNRVGYIKVEDLRCIFENMGKFLSNRDVKDLVQAAVSESNSANDNHVIYTNLVKMVDL